MKLTKIKILKTAPYKPHTVISKKLISEPLRYYIEDIKLNTSLEYNKGKYGDINAIANYFKVDVDIKRFRSLAGCANLTERKIIVSNSHTDSQAEIRATFCHELSHILQYDVGIFDLRKNYTLSSCLRQEQEAEASASELYRIFFKKYFYQKNLFKNYFSEPHILHLHRYHSTAQNDLFEWL